MEHYQWAVIGAGPAGIATVGSLLDQGETNILWVDPHFSVGDFGTTWAQVPSNTKIESFNYFLHACESFRYTTCPTSERLEGEPGAHCQLGDMAKPLQWITNSLFDQVTAHKGWVSHLRQEGGMWRLRLQDQSFFHAEKVVLATGAEPKALAYDVPTLGLADVFHPERCEKLISNQEVIGVFGASHSGVLAVKNVLEAGAGRVIHFYAHPTRYAIFQDDWVLFDNTGLKGVAADWAREYIDGIHPENFERVYARASDVEHYVKQCDKVVYAVGFDRRAGIEVVGYPNADYQPQTGVIAPGLFGVGIAYPEVAADRMGVVEARVGLKKFMKYLDKVLPLWQAG